MWKIPPFMPADHKYSRGHVLVLGGDEMPGAARLTALAAQRAGAGMVSLAVSPKVWPVYAASMLSVIVRAADAEGWVALVADARIGPVVIGPGAGTRKRTVAAIGAAAKAGKTLILDADALTLLAADQPLRRTLQSAPMICTPHEGEYARLAKALKLKPPIADKVACAQALAAALGAVVVFKGAQTVVADAAGRAVVTHPPAWLATAGTGDVLAGVIAALVGQGMPLFNAAAAGVWLHAEAARLHGRGMIAEDVIAGIPTILRALK